MGSIQLALTDASLADRLQGLLARSTSVPVNCTESPDIEGACVVVVDPAHLGLLPAPLPYPDRVVLITQKDPAHLSDAWEAGLNSVVFNQDSLNTVVLAVLAACLRNETCRKRLESAGSEARSGANSGDGRKASRTNRKEAES
jgi:hypothetical protein